MAGHGRPKDMAQTASGGKNTPAKGPGIAPPTRSVTHIKQNSGPDFKNPLNNSATAQQLQKFLNTKGYKIPIDGKIGPLTISAMNDWHSGVGHRSGVAWTAKNIGDPGSSVKTSSLTDNSSSGPRTASSAKGGSPASTVAKNIPYPTGGANTISNSILPILKQYGPEVADAMAGQQYDPQINQTNVDIGRQKLDSKQSIQDITNWLNTVQSAQKGAATADASAGATATANTGNAAAAILASLGGSANPAAAALAEQGASDSAGVAQQAMAQDQYQNNLAPILANQKSSALQNQTNLNTKNAQDLSTTLASLMGQRGQAKVTDQMQLNQMNNQNQQSQFQNQFGLDQFNAGQGQQQFSNWATIQELQQAAALNNAQVKYYGTASTAGGFQPWAKLNASQKQQLINAAIQNVVDGQGALLPQYAKNPQQAWLAARNYLKGQGFNSAYKASASDPAAYTQITSLLGPAITRAQGIAQQKAALGQ